MKYSLFFALPLLAGTLAAAPVELQQEIAAGISSGKNRPPSRLSPCTIACAAERRISGFLVLT